MMFTDQRKHIISRSNPDQPKLCVTSIGSGRGTEKMNQIESGVKATSQEEAASKDVVAKQWGQEDSFLQDQAGEQVEASLQD